MACGASQRLGSCPSREDASPAWTLCRAGRLCSSLLRDELAALRPFDEADGDDTVEVDPTIEHVRLNLEERRRCLLALAYGGEPVSARLPRLRHSFVDLAAILGLVEAIDGCRRSEVIVEHDVRVLGRLGFVLWDGLLHLLHPCEV